LLRKQRDVRGLLRKQRQEAQEAEGRSFCFLGMSFLTVLSFHFLCLFLRRMKDKKKPALVKAEFSFLRLTDSTRS